MTFADQNNLGQTLSETCCKDSTTHLEAPNVSTNGRVSGTRVLACMAPKALSVLITPYIHDPLTEGPPSGTHTSKTLPLTSTDRRETWLIGGTSDGLRAGAVAKVLPTTLIA